MIQLPPGLHRQPSADDLDKAARMMTSLHAGQTRVREDTHPRKSLIAGRRGGKTYGEAADLAIGALQIPESSNLFISLNREHGKELLWRNKLTGLAALNADYNLGMKLVEKDSAFYFPNGSRISLFGATREDDLSKIFGVAKHKVKVEECHTFAPARLRRLLDVCVIPTLKDYGGSLTLLGNPGTVPIGPWWEATSIYVYGESPFENERPLCRPYAARREPPWSNLSDDDFYWSCHRYGAQDNTKMPHLWAESLAEKRRKRWADDNPIWVRMHVGLWLIDFSALVYRYRPEADWDGPPLPRGHQWEHMASVFWKTDGTAAVVGLSYSRSHSELFQTFEAKIPNAGTHQVAAALREMDRQWPIDFIVGGKETSGDTLFDDMRTYHNLSIEQVNVSALRDLQILANTDLSRNRVHMIKNSELRAEVLRLQWKDPGVEMDTAEVGDALTSAFVIGFQHCYHRGKRDSTNKPPQHGTREYWEKFAADEERSLAERERRSQDPSDWLEDELGNGDQRDFIDDFHARFDDDF